MKRTYVDSNVLIAAASKKGPLVAESLKFLDDARTEFVSSIFVQLEVYPYARKHRQQSEIGFFDDFFGGVAAWPTDYERVSSRAIEILSQFPISALDALHVACALELGADELVTLEGAHKGICKTKLLDVITLGAASNSGRAHRVRDIKTGNKASRVYAAWCFQANRSTVGTRMRGQFSPFTGFPHVPAGEAQGRERGSSSAPIHTFRFLPVFREVGYPLDSGNEALRHFVGRTPGPRL